MQQQLTPEEQRDFDEHYGDDSDVDGLLFGDEDEFNENQLAEALNGENHIDEECDGDLITNNEELGDEIDLEGQQDDDGENEDDQQASSVEMDYYMR